MSAGMDYTQAQAELRSLVASVSYEIINKYSNPGAVPEEIAAEVVEALVVGRPDVLDALGESPRRFWVMGNCTLDGKPVFGGTDEWDNPTIAVWIGWGRYLVVSYGLRLNKLRAPLGGRVPHFGGIA